MKKTILILLMLMICIMITSCNSDTELLKTSEKEIATTNLTEATSQNDKTELKDYLELIDGSTFIHEYKINNDSVSILYSVKSIESKENLTKKDFDDYFLTGDKIDKILVSVPLRLFNNYSYLKTIEIKIEADKNYNINLNKDDVIKLIGEINKENIDKYTYDKNLRKEFLNNFE